MKAITVSLVLASAVSPAWPCGVCAEDKMAATYDHEVVTRARQAGHVVVFCELVGVVDAARLAGAAARQRGVEAGSIRISPEPAAMSFSLDTRKQSPQDAVAAIQKAVPPRTRVSLLRVQ
jgi:hypothetical protein